MRRIHGPGADKFFSSAIIHVNLGIVLWQGLTKAECSGHPMFLVINHILGCLYVLRALAQSSFAGLGMGKHRVLLATYDLDVSSSCPGVLFFCFFCVW